MIIRELDIKGLFEIIPEPFTDHRGFFMRVYDREMFRKYGIDRQWVQENHSGSSKKDTVRGLHFQIRPFSETKLVRCIRGAIFDVAVDLRSSSASFGKWYGTELSEANRKMLYIPKGFAHGFCSLTDNSEVVYKVDMVYSPEHERGILWSDSEIGIAWPVRDPIISEKDRGNMTYREFIESGLKL